MNHDHTHEIGSIHRELQSHLPSEPALRVKALESLLVEKGMLDLKAVDAWIDFYREEIGPKRGALVVAKAWSDPGFKARLLADAETTIARLGFGSGGSGHFRVVENTTTIHNLVVCTLCSCYPIAVLGIPPNWYKTAAYRARAVRDPRSVLEEFGVKLHEDVEVRVWDSTSELRYIVLPERPGGTDGWNDAQLARLVTRNSMIGTERDLSTRVQAAR